jgi:Uma2 family endonuclease
MNEPMEHYASFDDVLSAPEAKIAELLDGVLYLSPRRACREIAAAGALLQELGPAFHRDRTGPGGWLILDQPMLRIGRDVLVPDLAAWRRERLSVLPDADYLKLAPDWVCEILSPHTGKLDRIDKKPRYAAQAVQYLWLVDPSARIVETRELVNGRWTDVGDFGDDASIRALPFQELELDLSRLWRDVESARDRG